MASAAAITQACMGACICCCCCLGLQQEAAFRSFLELTTGDDLRQLLWVRSSSSSSWLQQRRSIAAGHAAMAACGYLCGIGDRHPGNLLLCCCCSSKSCSGCCIAHIDFSDVFEAAAYRRVLPETVPFRFVPKVSLYMFSLYIYTYMLYNIYIYVV